MLYIIVAAVLVLLVIVIVVVKKKKDAPISEEQVEATQTPIAVKTPKEEKELPACDYPQFSHARLLEMGLGEEEALEFVGELIPEIENNISSIHSFIEDKEYEELERLIHGIKGASNNVGTGGVSELLTEFHLYLRNSDAIDKEVSMHYAKHLRSYTDVLKKAYP
jgi:hypothetical protein